MKMSTLIAVGALATGMLAAAPAEAQRYGHDYGHRGYRGGQIHPGFPHRYDGARGGYFRGYGHRERFGYRGGYGRGYAGRVRCRIVRGYYGPERRCFRIY